MLASKLIEELQKLVEEHDDWPVGIAEYFDGGAILADLSVVGVVYQDGHKYSGLEPRLIIY